MNQKMCSKCDGLIDFDVIACPYCGSDVSFDGDKDSFQENSFQENSFQENSFFKSKNKDLKDNNLSDGDLSNSDLSNDDLSKMQFSKLYFSRISFFTFSFGLNMFLFGVFLFLFSSKGRIFLSWNAKLWFLYILLGLPIMFIGSKLFKKSP